MKQPIQTKEKIITSARKLFSEKGFKGATTAAIAKSAGISEGTIYRHFSSKEELLAACVIPVLEDLVEKMDIDFSKIKDLRNLVMKVLQIRLESFERHYETFRILFNELPYSQEMLNGYLSFLSQQESRLSRMTEHIQMLGNFSRNRNYMIFGLGQIMSLWLLVNFKEWQKDEKLTFSNEMLHISEEHILDDLADYILYGISGVPGKEHESED